jgi:hypothetical protein
MDIKDMDLDLKEFYENNLKESKMNCKIINAKNDYYDRKSNLSFKNVNLLANINTF